MSLSCFWKSSSFLLILLSVGFIHCQDYLPSQTIIVDNDIHSIDIDDSNDILTFATYDPFFKVYKNDGTTFSKINQLNPGDDGENVDVTPDGKFIFATTYGTSYPNKLFEYIDSSTGYSVIQDIKTGSVYSYSGFISDDSQIIGAAANNSINIYENDGTNNFVFSYTLSTGVSGNIRNLKLSEDGTFLVASLSSGSSFYVFTRTGSNAFSLNQTITLQFAG